MSYRFGTEDLATSRHRANLRAGSNSSGNGSKKSDFSPNLLKQIEAAESRAAVESQAAGDSNRQYARSSPPVSMPGPRVGRRDILPPISSAKNKSKNGRGGGTSVRGPPQHHLQSRRQQQATKHGARPGADGELSTSGRQSMSGAKTRKHLQQQRRTGSGLDMIGVNDRFVEAAGEARVDFVIQRIQDGQNVDHVHSLLGYTALHAAADVAGARGGVNLGQLVCCGVLQDTIFQVLFIPHHCCLCLPLLPVCIEVGGWMGDWGTRP